MPQDHKRWEYLFGPWEAAWHSCEKRPSSPIGLQSAIQRIIEKIELQNGTPIGAKAEERIRVTACRWLQKHLAAASRRLMLYRDGGAAGFWMREAKSWERERADSDGRFMQNSILDRERDERGKYVFDSDTLNELLDAEFGQAGAAVREVRDATDRRADENSPSKDEAKKKTPGRRGRKPGDGVKNDDAALQYMFRLFKDGNARSKREAAEAAIQDLKLVEVAANAWRRLSDKFTRLYGPKRRRGETWRQTCRRIADELQTK